MSLLASSASKPSGSAAQEAGSPITTSKRSTLVHNMTESDKEEVLYGNAARAYKYN